MQKSFIVLMLLAIATMVASPALSRDTWKEPSSWTKSEAPNEIAITRADAHEQRRRPRGGARMPELRVSVLDANGYGVSGVGVSVGARIGKRRGDTVRKYGSTGDGGRFHLKHDGVDHVTKLALVFKWGDGAKNVGVNLEPGSGNWSIAEAPYKDIDAYQDAGSCRNRFELQRTENKGIYDLTFHLPDSLLSCEKVEYGVERKGVEFAKIHQIGDRDINRGDKNQFSRDDEAKIGLEASREFDKQFEHVTDPVVVDYVQGIMEKVVRNSDDPSMPIHLRVVHTDAVNAFVTAGGHVYVFTGLIKAAQNESQLAGVLAHEASHAIGRHVTEGATRNMKTQLGALLGALVVGTAADMDSKEMETLMVGSMIGAGLVGLKYDRRAESEADLLGAQYLWNAGWDPEGIARFFEVLHDSGGAQPPAWMSTHPSHEKRIQNGIQWSRAFLPERDRYLQNTDEFLRVQDRVNAMPPPKKDPTKQKDEEAASLRGFLESTPTFQKIVGSYVQQSTQP